MGTNMHSNMTELIDQATQTFGSALQTGIRLQREAARWWSDMLQEANSLQRLQTRAQGMMTEIIPNTQQNVGQFLSWVDRSYHTTLDLFSRAMDSSQSQSYYEAQRHMIELWQTSLGIMRANVQAMTQLNGRMVESWARMAQENTMRGAEAAQAGIHAARSTAAKAEKMAGSGMAAEEEGAPKTGARRRNRGPQKPKRQA